MQYRSPLLKVLLLATFEICVWTFEETVDKYWIFENMSFEMLFIDPAIDAFPGITTVSADEPSITWLLAVLVALYPIAVESV